MSPPSMGGPVGLGHDFDVSLLKKEKDSFEGYNFERITPQHPQEKATWSLVTKTKMPLSQSELIAMVNKQKRKGPSAWQLLKSDEMKGFKRKQVDQLIDDRTRADPRFGYELAALKLDQYSDRRGTRGTSAFQVILRRHLRSDLANAGSAGLGKLQEPHREIVDLTGLSEEPSEGSSQGFFGGSSPPRHHFAPPPHHEFQGHHGLKQPPHQPPFIHHPNPPMHEVHHDLHPGPPPHPHMPHFEDPFIHLDPRQARPPPPPFAPHMQPHMPHFDGPKGNSNERPKEAKESKEMKPKKDLKDSKDLKPTIHQVKLQNSEKKHGRESSESDWDYLSESSDFSQAYTDQTPDTAYSSNSSRKEKKSYHHGKDSRRSSRNRRDDYSHERHDEVYRIHRRKPTMSPDRSRPSARSRHEVDEVEVIPGSNLKSHRPYLARSQTVNNRPERFPEALERPAFNSRHMSYDDDRHHSLHGLTSPGRRASVYAPKRSLALDLYDAREEQERLEREEIRRELIRDERRKEEIRREERRKEELRESVARQLQRKAEERRPPIGRERGLSNERYYDERPGRYSRGYDNDRFMW
ncbi:MAG: hypothetical protein Q9170_004321 [Blastenia crenularia]